MSTKILFTAYWLINSILILHKFSREHTLDNWVKFRILPFMHKMCAKLKSTLMFWTQLPGHNVFLMSIYLYLLCCPLACRARTTLVSDSYLL